MELKYPFELQELPYAYEALEPYIDVETMHIHHDRHVKTYNDNLNNALKDHEDLQGLSLEQLMKELPKIPEAYRTPIKNNAGGVYNHNFYFSILSPDSKGAVVGELKEAIDKVFGSFDNFKEEFKKNALGRFGSGWAWLVVDDKKELKIISTANQDSVLELGYVPIIVIDVWEHAYYLKYQNKRADYVDQWFHVVDWDMANQKYLDAIK
ncbi:superoxide dismutase [Anaeromicropila herbilytica]|uniref:Superoxide dismutase n=1 Tax=Anaeromicropila herbilytica TaxID=2785025 RepID=A0A7R7EPX9_9FIRM|nr:superoxide dismutase [Anaeromicropila herbilytica]BCN32570.1 superoxide dismutase [Anaeromicropila herbilytica]